MPTAWLDWGLLTTTSTATSVTWSGIWANSTTSTTTTTTLGYAASTATSFVLDWGWGWGEPAQMFPATPSGFEEVERRQAGRAVAIARATDLLLMLLDPVQRVAYEADRAFEVVGSHGGLYRIRPGSVGNVDVLDAVTREVTGRLCAHPSMVDGHLPDPDVAVAQLLHLTTDEPRFCRTANVHRGRRPGIAALAA